MSKVKKIDKAGFRGKVRQCPSCDGRPVVSAYRRKNICETCFGSGVVYQGVYCPFCGRSPQVEHKGLLICGTALCKAEAEKKPYVKQPLMTSDEFLENYEKLYGLFS